MIVEVPDSFLKQAAQPRDFRVDKNDVLKPFRVQIEWGAVQKDGWIAPNGYMSQHRYPEDFRVIEAVHDLPEQVAERVVMRMGDKLAEVFKRFGLRDVLSEQ